MNRSGSPDSTGPATVGPIKVGPTETGPPGATRAKRHWAANPLRLDDGRILVEQFQLLLGNVGSTVIPALVLALLLTWSLVNDSNALALKIWCAAVIAAKLYSEFDARRALKAGISIEQAPRLVWILMALKGVDGALWGVLAWVTLDTSSVAGSILVLAFLAGIAGSAVSLYSPVFPVFVMFIAGELVITAAKLWQMGDPAYQTLGIIVALYLVTLFQQAKNSAAAARAAINLRFENIELMAQLRVETQKAQDADLAKSKFLAAASHDLRQPIQAQALFLEVIRRGDLSADQRAGVEGANAAMQASTSILNALLDFSRIEAGVVEAKRMRAPLQAMLDRLGHEMAPQAAQKGLTYRCHRSRQSGTADLVVYTDPALIEMIVRNLVANAIRYTERGGVLIGCRQRRAEVLLEVWDSGIGIEPAQQTEVFREFHQLGNPERDRNKGLGLGLAIAQGLARTLGHGLTLASRPRRGSVFRLALPLATAVLPPGADDGGASAKTAAPVATGAAESTLASARVLVVEDDDTVRAGLLALLGSWGCECEGVDSIETALARAAVNPPDLIISDYRLRASRTGAEAIAALRTQASFEVPALLITGDTSPERLREALASGIPLLHKPVPPQALHDRLLSLLGAPA